MAETLRARVAAGEATLGTFVKTPHHAIVEVLGSAGLDFAVIDAEHAPFDADALDRTLLGAASASLECLVRPQDLGAAFIGRSLDLGAAGILAPHVTGPDAAAHVVAAARFAKGQRGFSPSTRAGGYGTQVPAAYRARADAATSVWCQIEDAEALEVLDAIAATDGVDGLFIGRADLALSLGVDRFDAPAMTSAIAAIAEAARRHGRGLGVYLGDPSEIEAFLALGARLLVCGSDQSWLMAQARATRAALKTARGG